MRRKKRKRIARMARQPRVLPEAPNERRSMNFMADSLAIGGGFRTLNVVDDYTRECVAIDVWPTSAALSSTSSDRETGGRPQEVPS